MWTALATDPASVYAEAYDVVLNGYELWWRLITGSIHENYKKKCFETLGFTKEKKHKTNLVFLLDALDYGFPPHGGIALELNRLAMLLAGGRKTFVK